MCMHKALYWATAIPQTVNSPFLKVTHNHNAQTSKQTSGILSSYYYNFRWRRGPQFHTIRTQRLCFTQCKSATKKRKICSSVIFRPIWFFQWLSCTATSPPTGSTFLLSKKTPRVFGCTFFAGVWVLSCHCSNYCRRIVDIECLCWDLTHDLYLQYNQQVLQFFHGLFLREGLKLKWSCLNKHSLCHNMFAQAPMKI